MTVRSQWVVSTFMVVGLSLAGVFPALAYRPFDFSDADVAERHTLEIEFAPFEFSERGQERAIRVPTLSLNLGLGRGFEFSVEGVNEIPTHSDEEELGPHVVETGASITKLLRQGNLQDKNGPSIAVEEMVLFPTTEGPHLGSETSAVVSTAAWLGVIHFGVEAARLPTGEDEAGAGLIIEAEGEHGWRPVCELKVIGTRGEPPDKGVLFGVIYEPATGLAFDAGVNLGQSGGVHWSELRGGVTYQIGTRGIKNVQRLVKSHLRRRHR